jgi:hypothetical protein
MWKKCCIVGVLAFCCHALAATKYMRFGKLIDGKGKLWTNVAVVVDNDRIRSVEADARRPREPR